MGSILVLAWLLACSAAPEAAPAAAPPELDRTCDSHLDCGISCTVAGDCCDQPCGPCNQVYNRLSAKTVEVLKAAQCLDHDPKDCPVADCDKPTIEYEARCVDGQCEAVAVPLVVP